MSSPYCLLGVAQDASQQQIKSAFFNKIRVEHPDKSSNDDKQQIAANLIEAYKVLSDPILRTKLDEELQNGNLKANYGQCFQNMEVHREDQYVDYECEQCGELNSVSTSTCNKDDQEVVVECRGCNLKFNVHIN